MLWKWAKRRHPNKKHQWIVDKYWKEYKGRRWAFRTEKSILFSMSDMPIVRKSQMALDKNAFLDKEYFQKRSQKHRQKRKMAMSSNNAAHIGIMRYRCVSGMQWKLHVPFLGEGETGRNLPYPTPKKVGNATGRKGATYGDIQERNLSNTQRLTWRGNWF